MSNEEKCENPPAGRDRYHAEHVQSGRLDLTSGMIFVLLVGFGLLAGYILMSVTTKDCPESNAAIVKAMGDTNTKLDALTKQLNELPAKIAASIKDSTKPASELTPEQKAIVDAIKKELVGLAKSDEVKKGFDSVNAKLQELTLALAKEKQVAELEKKLIELQSKVDQLTRIVVDGKPQSR